MGQTNSRHHEPSLRPTHPTPSTNPVAGASTDPQPAPSVDVDAPTSDASTSDASGSRRSSVRKNILKFVKPSSIRSRLSTVPSNLGEAGRSVRNSRRWSKTPLDTTTQPLEPQLASSSNSLTEGPSNLPPSPLDKGKQREIIPQLEEEEGSTEANVINMDQTPQLPSATPIPDPNVNAVTPTLDNAQFATDAFADPRAASDDPSHDVQLSEDLEFDSSIQGPSPVYEWESNGTTSLPEPQPSPSPQQSTALPPRQFPPPGTLVVVQGIVHTTDVSRVNIPPSFSHSPHGDSSPSSSNSRPASGLDPASEQGSGRTRNRLSALLRPRSTSSRPPSALMNDSTPAVVLTGPSDAESSPASASESQSSSDESTQTGITTPTLNEPVDSPQDDPPPAAASLPATESRVPSISSSSIDVLGTLLSVAAAATAASLLTGSSEPILSSGLAPPGHNPSVPTSTSPISPTASLPNLPTYPRSPTPNADISAAGRAERMRQAWGTIRERLGLRPSVPPPDAGASNIFPQDSNGGTPSPSLFGGDAAASGTPTDTRELMLAEMARAFNIGLGLNGLGGISPTANGHAADREAVGVPNNSSDEEPVAAEGSESDSPSQPRSGPATGNAGVTLPPEGSFERFLVDLQIDLRAALTQAEDEADTSQEQQREPQDLHAPVVSTSATGPTDDAFSSSSTAPASLPVHEQSSTGNVNSPEAADDDFYSDMPHLQEVSDSESEFDEDDHEDGDDDDDFHSVVHESADAQGQTGPSNDQSRPPMSGTGRIDASGRINWWRLYRFPPILSPRMDMAGLRQPFVSTQTPSSPLTGPSSLSNPSPTPILADTAPSSTATTDGSSASTDTASSVPLPQSPTTAPSAQASPQVGGTPLSQVPLHAVVPVIVVGLQSVNQEWRPEMPSQGDNEGMDFFGPPGSEENVNGLPNENGDEDDLDGWGGQHHMGPGATGLGARGRGRARGWHSRAANALRNLRPGRRNVEAGSDAQTHLAAPGSRTFLIYVIGGYYPPDHSIVTGGPNILDSFEALLELADLLGQVKPPTVSKDDIEKSGLKIIKASEMEQQEKEGKVASNCLDRCLICLDDYEPEDPIRVMTCRHAFHKSCVDEWLQKGRNNCPACRSTGVTTHTHPSPATPVPAS